MMSPVELGQEFRTALGERSVDFETGIRPAPNPIAVVQVGLGGRSVAGVCFMVAATGAERPCPTGRAVGLVRDVVPNEKVVLTGVVDAVEHRAELVCIRAGESMAQRDVAVGRH